MSTQNTAEFNTPNIQASQAPLVAHTSIHIEAPASLVFRILRNTETWKDWNRFVPRVNITYQPPEEDLVTAAEIAEIVRNTSIAGTFESDLTEAGVPANKHRSPDEQPPPRVRLNSTASRASESSQNRFSSDAARTQGDTLMVPGSPNPGSRKSSTGDVNGSTLSAAQKFQAAQASRKASIASGHTPEPAAGKLINPDEMIIHASAPSPTPPATPANQKGRRKSVDVKAASKAAAASVSHLYGEPSVRIQLRTKMVFFARMKPNDPSDLKQTSMVVTEVSRPDDPFTEPSNLTTLTRAKTHTLSRAGIYRIVWTMDHEGASAMNLSGIFSGGKVPKYLLQAERVHEIRPIFNGDGSETSCEYKTWECQKGPLAKVVMKKYGVHIQEMFKVWGYGLKDFCEGLNAPGISRRDFSVAAVLEE